MEKSICPVCTGNLKVIGSKKRHLSLVRDEMLIMAVALLLFLAGSAVFLFVLAGSQQSSMDILLKK